MSHEVDGSTPNQPGPEAVREQLKRILDSDLFSRGPRLARFLSYIVEATISGNAEQLNQLAIGLDVFDRGRSFDPSTDAIVRVEAGRLRYKLTEYYDNAGTNDPIVISLPRGGYHVSVQHRASTEPVGQPVARGAPRLGVAALLAASTVGFLYAAFALLPDQEKTAPGATTASADVRPGSIGQPTAAFAGRQAIAILPFNNLSNDPEQDYFSDGITEDIITDLSLVSGLNVIARHSTFVYKNQNVSIKDIGDDLGARYVLEGSVRKAGDQLRITAQLIDVATETHIWAERYDRRLDDIFATQDEVSQQIVNSLDVELTDLERNRLRHRGTESLEAHDYYLRARDLFYLFTDEGVNRAIELFSEAIEVDPAYAEAHAWLSRAITYTFVAGIDTRGPAAVEEALALARRSVDLDENLPLAHANLAWALRWQLEIEAATDAVNTAIELNPNFADAYLWQSLILSTAGNGEDALASVEQAMLFDPHYSVTHIFALGRAYLILGRADTALYHFERGIERNPNFIPNHTHRLLALERLGMTEAHEAARTELVRIAPNYQQSPTYRFYRN